MKHIFLAIAFFFGSQALAQGPLSQKTEIQVFAEKYGAPFMADILPSGYSAVKVPHVLFSKELKDRLQELNDQRTKEWAEYVATEYDYLDQEAQQSLIDNAQDEWGSPTPLRIDGTYAIYKNGVLIGYVLDVSDMVDSAIIQDGSGWAFYMDAQYNFVYEADWQS